MGIRGLFAEPGYTDLHTGLSQYVAGLVIVGGSIAGGIGAGIGAVVGYRVDKNSGTRPP